MMSAIMAQQPRKATQIAPLAPTAEIVGGTQRSLREGFTILPVLEILAVGVFATVVLAPQIVVHVVLHPRSEAVVKGWLIRNW